MKKPPVVTYVRPRQRAQTLAIRRNRKMARSVHAYVRGNTARYYEWLADAKVGTLPEGPAIWICGDCHTGNLGPVANDAGEIEIQIRDLDQTVIGNPVHDLIRLSLSLATAARSSDLPGIVTARIIEQVHEGYMHALAAGKRKRAAIPKPDVVRIVMRTALERTWKHLARERLMGVKPVLPLGKRFWPLSRAESNGIAALVDTPAIAELAVGLRGNRPAKHVELLDAAYWVKGCSSLGRLRYAVLLDVDGAASEGDDLCLVDIKEGTTALAPRYRDSEMPRDNGKRVVEGARHLSPYLGNRMCAATLSERSVIVRELLPADLKLEIGSVDEAEALRIARYLAHVVGLAHARQMDTSTRARWLAELKRVRSKTIDAPFWLWRSVIELMGNHEVGYLEHCRRVAAQRAGKR
ncbi:DUF2252 family protein [Burkholderia gladioli]|uniref:DUF2252 family protein n=1 Tax=Burkholderia gladioli TaxID=28095 RepID=UPI001640F6DA|nr:DUF2252 family protein [Burkholderia gladioli]